MAATVVPAMATANSIQNKRSRALGRRNERSETGSSDDRAERFSSRLPCMVSQYKLTSALLHGGAARRQSAWQALPFGLASPPNSSEQMTNSIALIVGSWRGHSPRGEVPKQYLRSAAARLLRHSVETFLRHRAISGVRAVISPEHRALYDNAVAGLSILPPVAGGASRQDSVRNGLESLAELQPNCVLIHDAARPFLTAEIVDRTLAALDDAPGAVVAVPVTDTLKRGHDDRVAGTVDRSALWRAQTPQAFRYADILAAHRQAKGAAMTDDAAVAEAAGLPVKW
jgi:2-C-methyl-D-erythritol 4-phosphate cytidylyltransferase/2-C-methyl-D-erythritol 2,4-cyclodiphosphate synthase